MKSSVKLLFVFGIIFALIIGLFVGLSFKIGNINQTEISGTIAKVNNYRKAQIEATGTNISSQLLSDTLRLKNMQNYLRFHYATSAKMAGDIRFSIDEANADQGFKNKYSKEISDLVTYERSFAPARTDLLIALRACLNPGKTDPLLFGEFINQANNVIARMNFQNRIILDFVDILDSYLRENKTMHLNGLTRAHDLLLYNELYTGLKTRDKLVLKSFSKKGFLSVDKNQKLVDPKGLADLMKKDLEKLSLLDAEIPALKDGEKLGFDDLEKIVWRMAGDAEKLGLMDSEKLGAFDSEKLGGTADSEKLGSEGDAEKLGGTADSEKLGGSEGDAEKLGGGTADSEKLGGWATADSEKLGND